MKFQLFIKFTAIGGLGFLLDLFSTYLLLNLGSSPFLARIPGFSLSIGITYFLTKKFVFRTEDSRKLRFANYLSIVLLGVFVNYTSYLIVFNALNFDSSLASIAVAIGAATGLIWNYSMNNYLYSKKKNK